MRGSRKISPGDMLSAEECDLRKWVFPGDMIQYQSTMRARTYEEAQRAKGATVPNTAPVVAVHRDFVFVKLGVCEEGCNRWGIKKLNGKPFPLYAVK